MTPEHATGLDSVEPRSDIFQLGGVLYERLTGHPPWEDHRGLDFGELVRQLKECRVRAPRELAPEIPRDLDAIIRKAMARDRGERYDCAHALRDDLLSFRRGEPVKAYAGGLVYRLEKRLRKLGGGREPKH